MESRNAMRGFHTFGLDLYPNESFVALVGSAQLEPIKRGRFGTNIAHINRGVARGDEQSRTQLVPLVRTTNRYQNATQSFRPIHYDLVNHIKSAYVCRGFGPNIEFNHALVEVYDSRYKSMGYHSDQAQDLADGSFICLFSCYSDPNTKQLRTLRIKNKTTAQEYDIVLRHNSVVLFSIATNSGWLHKIMLAPENRDVAIKWLGITFRHSRTLIRFINEIPYFEAGCPLTLANEYQAQKIFEARHTENNATEFGWPQSSYTISGGDLLPPM